MKVKTHPKSSGLVRMPQDVFSTNCVSVLLSVRPFYYYGYGCAEQVINLHYYYIAEDQYGNKITGKTYNASMKYEVM